MSHPENVLQNFRGTPVGPFIHNKSKRSSGDSCIVAATERRFADVCVYRFRFISWWGLFCRSISSLLFIQQGGMQ
jgi:hypothetical protein